MAKGKATVFFCQDCGYESSKWMGQCPGCGGWNTFVEELIDKSAPAKVRKEAAKAEVVKILPPFGDTLRYITIGAIVVAVIAIVGVGIVFIKKKVLTK